MDFSYTVLIKLPMIDVKTNIWYLPFERSGASVVESGADLIVAVAALEECCWCSWGCCKSPSLCLVDGRPPKVVRNSVNWSCCSFGSTISTSCCLSINFQHIFLYDKLSQHFFTIRLERYLFLYLPRKVLQIYSDIWFPDLDSEKWLNSLFNIRLNWNWKK